ncbi:MAG: hypothetical protein ABII72_01105 [Parcubacteria group bacterium]
MNSPERGFDTAPVVNPEVVEGMPAVPEEAMETEAPSAETDLDRAETLFDSQETFANWKNEADKRLDLTLERVDADNVGENLNPETGEPSDLLTEATQEANSKEFAMPEINLDPSLTDLVDNPKGVFSTSDFRAYNLRALSEPDIDIAPIDTTGEMKLITDEYGQSVLEKPDFTETITSSPSTDSTETRLEPDENAPGQRNLVVEKKKEPTEKESSLMSPLLDADTRSIQQADPNLLDHYEMAKRAKSVRGPREQTDFQKRDLPMKLLARVDNKTVGTLSRFRDSAQNMKADLEKLAEDPQALEKLGFARGVEKLVRVVLQTAEKGKALAETFRTKLAWLAEVQQVIEDSAEDALFPPAKKSEAPPSQKGLAAPSTFDAVQPRSDISPTFHEDKTKIITPEERADKVLADFIKEIKAYSH